MINSILTAAGVPHHESRFPAPQPDTFAVYMDDVEAGGADGRNILHTHGYTVELYARTIAAAAAAEDALEAELATRGIPWTKQAKYWLDDVQRYQTVYDFTTYEKRRA